jgi:hypothetical protein
MRREQKRLIDIENIKIAQKLMSVRGSKDLKKDCLEKGFDKHLQAKAVLCKLPIIDMAQNRFHSGKGAEARGEELSVRDYRRMIRNQNSHSPS